MIDKLLAVFEQLGYPAVRQGSFAEDDELPTSFFTFWNVASSDDLFYNNHRNQVQTVYAVYFYTSDPRLIYSKLNEFIDFARQSGFLVDGEGEDIDSDTPNYFGRYVMITYLENKI